MRYSPIGRESESDAAINVAFRKGRSALVREKEQHARHSNAVASCSHSWRSTLSYVLIVLIVGASCIPKSWVLNIRVLDIPVNNWICGGAMAILVGVNYRANAPFQRGALVGGAMGVVYSLVMGCAFFLDHPVYPRFIINDIMVLVGLLGGYLVGCAIVVDGGLRVYGALTYWIGLGFMVLTLCGLQMGWVTNRGSDERMLDLSAYTCVIVLLNGIAVDILLGRRWLVLAWIRVALGAVAVVYFAGISATRSVVLELVAVLGFCLFAAKWPWRIKLAAIALFFGVIGFVVYSPTVIERIPMMTGLAGRFLDTDFEGEIRYSELMYLVDSYGYRLLWGGGVGSWFPSPVSAGFANCPHIGILYPSVKAGVLGMLLLVAWPACLALRSITESTAPSRSKTGGALVLAFFATALTSPVFVYEQTFLFGVALAFMARWRTSK